MKRLLLFLIIILYFWGINKFSFFLQSEKIESFIIRAEPISILISVFLFILLFFSQRKKIFQIFSRINKKTLLILLFIFFIALFLRNIAPNGHRIFFDEDIYLDMSNQIATSMNSCLCNYGDSTTCFKCEMMKWPAGHPFLFAILFFLFGTNEGITFSFASFIGSFSVILIFFLVYLLINNEKTSLYASLLLALVPIHILWSGTIISDLTLSFLMIFSMLFIFLHTKIKNDKSFLLALLSIAFVVSVKIESLVFILVALVAFLFYDKDIWQRIKKPKNIAIVIFVLILLVPFFLHFLYSSKVDTWGAPNGEKFGIEYLKSNIVDNSKFWLDYVFWNKTLWQQKQLYHPVGFTFLAVTGIIYLFIKRKLKILTLLSFWFFSFFFLYAFFYAGSVLTGVDVRYTIPQFSSFCILGAIGLSAFEYLIRKSFKKFSHLAFSVVFILPFILFAPYFSLIQTPIEEIEETYEVREYHNFATNFAKNTKEDCYFISHVSSIYSVSGKKYMQIWYVNQPQFKEVLKNNCVIFDDGYWCKIGVKESSTCLIFFRNYNLELLEEYKGRNKTYSFYKVLPANKD